MQVPRDPRLDALQLAFEGQQRRDCSVFIATHDAAAAVPVELLRQLLGLLAKPEDARQVSMTRLECRLDDALRVHAL